MFRSFLIAFFVAGLVSSFQQAGEANELGHKRAKRQSIIIISCRDNNRNCPLFKSFCTNPSVKFLNYAIRDLCQISCNTCSAGTTTSLLTSTSTTTSSSTITSTSPTTTTTTTTSTTSTTTTSTTSTTTTSTTSTTTTTTTTTTPSTTSAVSSTTGSTISTISSTTTASSTVTLDNCRLNPCLNGGTCISVDLSFVCLCIGFVGDRCQFVDPCVAYSPCQQGSACSVILFPNQADYFCECTGLAFGKNCSRTFTTADCFDASPYCPGLTQANCTSRATIIGVPVREACTRTCTGCTPGTTVSGQTTLSTGPATTTTSGIATTTTCFDLLTNCGVMAFYCAVRNAVLTYNGVSVPFVSLCASTCKIC